MTIRQLTRDDLPLVTAVEMAQWLNTTPDHVRRIVPDRLPLSSRQIRWSRSVLRRLTGQSRAPLLRAEEVAEMLAAEVRWVREEWHVRPFLSLAGLRRWRIEDVEAALAPATDVATTGGDAA